ncbi:MAG: hypothetical protein M3150_04440 [Pseudomonadota bacterium]|nr:hypothetical protein [Pseudomonadota bacterium]
MSSHVHIERTPPGPRAKPPRDHVQGWGADLDHANRPAYPMERTPPRLDGIPAMVPQLPKVEILRSNERPGLTPIFGTSTPPTGVSGMLRRTAFKYSENDLRHWLILLFADRVNVGEGIVEDLARGHVPNIFKEMGGPAEFRYNRAGAVRKVAIATAVTGLAIYLMKRKRR